MQKKSAIGAALIAAVLASAGGAAFLAHNHNPTLRDVFKACEAGNFPGSVVCCEDLTKVKDTAETPNQCGLISPGNPDPFGTRSALEDDWDKKHDEGQ
jgi:hypothetical protein